MRISYNACKMQKLFITFIYGRKYLHKGNRNMLVLFFFCTCIFLVILMPVIFPHNCSDDLTLLIKRTPMQNNNLYTFLYKFKEAAL